MTVHFFNYKWVWQQTYSYIQCWLLDSRGHSQLHACGRPLTWAKLGRGEGQRMCNIWSKNIRVWFALQYYSWTFHSEYNSMLLKCFKKSILISAAAHVYFSYTGFEGQTNVNNGVMLGGKKAYFYCMLWSLSIILGGISLRRTVRHCILPDPSPK